MNPPAIPTHRSAPAINGWPTQNTPPQRVDSLALLSGNRELIIEHAGCEYRLRRTQNDKLILTK